MKIGLILALGLALVAIGSAATDEEIVQYAKGAIAGSIQNPTCNVTASFDNDTLTMISQFNPNVISIGIDGVGGIVFQMTKAAETIVLQYPNRFQNVELVVYDPSNTLIGKADIKALSGKGVQWTG